MSQRLIAVFTPFEKLADPRVERTREHALFDLVVFVGACQEFCVRQELLKLSWVS